MKKNILLCGYFAFNTNDNGGQPVKSRELYHGLCEYFPEAEISYTETMGWKRHPFRLVKDYIKKSKNADCIIMLPAHNGLPVFARLLLFSKQRRNKKIYYDVIGGWLPEKLSENPSLLKVLKKFDGIWVETSSMKSDLNALGLQNIVVLPNFKKLNFLTASQMKSDFPQPYKLCTFSRVIKEKGIEDAVEAVRYINEKAERTCFTLDIYGQIDSGYAERFSQLREEFPEYVQYGGLIPYNKSVEVLKDYFALLFPTQYYTEGIPGTIIDAYAAGVPVITSLWKNQSDIFDHGLTGLGYKFGDPDGLKNALEIALDNPDNFVAMKENCLKKAKMFEPSAVIEYIKELIE